MGTDGDKELKYITLSGVLLSFTSPLSILVNIIQTNFMGHGFPDLLICVDEHP